MKKSIILTTALLAGITCGLGAGAAAGDSAKGYPEGELVLDGRKPARFSHETHMALGMECGVCHHDREHNSQTAEMIGAMPDTRQLQCTSCHNGEFADSELQRAKDVFHARCKTCHQEGYEGKSGPVKCGDCHVREKKAYEGC